MIEKTKKMLEVEAKVGMPVKDFLREKYGEDKKSVLQIATIIKIPSRTVQNWMEKFGIERRNHKEINIKYTKKDIESYGIKWMKEYAGKQPTMAKWDKNSNYPSSSTMIKHYGSWNNFIEEIGGKRYNSRYTKKELKNCWNNWLREHNGKQPKIEDWNKDPNYPCEPTISKYFGCWNNFVKETGGRVIRAMIIEDSIYSKRSYRKEICDKILDTLRKKPEEFVINDFRKVKLGKDYSGILYFYKHRFGLNSWVHALDELVKDLYGCPIRRYKVTKYTKEKLRDAWNRWLREHSGNDPKAREWGKEPNYPSIDPIIRYYGSWNNFVRAMGGKVNFSRKIYHSVYSIEDGIKDYFRYREECKAKSKKPTSLQSFFTKYGPKTLEPIKKGYGPLGKYSARYHRR